MPSKFCLTVLLLCGSLNLREPELSRQPRPRRGQQRIRSGGRAPLIARPFEYSGPDFAGLFASPIFRTGWVQPPDDGFFDQSATFLGGIGDYDWTEEWASWLVETDLQKTFTTSDAGLNLSPA